MSDELEAESGARSLIGSHADDHVLVASPEYGIGQSNTVANRQQGPAGEPRFDLLFVVVPLVVGETREQGVGIPCLASPESPLRPAHPVQASGHPDSQRGGRQKHTIVDVAVRGDVARDDRTLSHERDAGPGDALPVVGKIGTVLPLPEDCEVLLVAHHHHGFAP